MEYDINSIKERLDSVKSEFETQLKESIHSKALTERLYTVFTESEVLASDLSESAALMLSEEVEGALVKAQQWH